MEEEIQEVLQNSKEKDKLKYPRKKGSGGISGRVNMKIIGVSKRGKGADGRKAIIQLRVEENFPEERYESSSWKGVCGLSR